MEDDFTTSLLIILVLGAILGILIGGVKLGKYNQRVDIRQNKSLFFECIEKNEIEWCFDNFIVKPIQTENARIIGGSASLPPEKEKVSGGVR